MSSAGQQFVAGHIPGERVATETITADSAGFTAEAEIASIIAPLVTGRIYRVTFDVGIDISVAGVVRITLREDGVAGTRRQIREKEIIGSSNIDPFHLQAEFTAVATANKTFVATGEVRSGGGTGNINASTEFPSILYVDYIRDA